MTGEEGFPRYWEDEPCKEKGGPIGDLPGEVSWIVLGHVGVIFDINVRVVADAVIIGRFMGRNGRGSITQVDWQQCHCGGSQTKRNDG